MKTTYRYVTLPLHIVHGLTHTEMGKDSYLSDDRSSITYREIIEQGFRWIRTDGDTAVFELAVNPPKRPVGRPRKTEANQS